MIFAKLYSMGLLFTGIFFVALFINPTEDLLGLFLLSAIFALAMAIFNKGVKAWPQ